MLCRVFRRSSARFHHRSKVFRQHREILRRRCKVFRQQLQALRHHREVFRHGFEMLRQQPQALRHGLGVLRQHPDCSATAARCSATVARRSATRLCALGWSRPDAAARHWLPACAFEPSGPVLRPPGRRCIPRHGKKPRPEVRAGLLYEAAVRVRCARAGLVSSSRRGEWPPPFPDALRASTPRWPAKPAAATGGRPPAPQVPGPNGRPSRATPPWPGPKWAAPR